MSLNTSMIKSATFLDNTVKSLSIGLCTLKKIHRQSSYAPDSGCINRGENMLSLVTPLGLHLEALMDQILIPPGVLTPVGLMYILSVHQ